MASGDLKDFALGISGFNFSDLYTPVRLRALHDEFWNYANSANPTLRQQFQSLSSISPKITAPQESEILIQTAKVLGDFIAKLFNISSHTSKIRAETHELQPIYRLKKDFLNIRVFKRLEESPCDSTTFKELETRTKKLLAHEPLGPNRDEELQLARIVLFFTDCEKKLKTGLDPVETQRIQHLCSHLHTSSIEEKIAIALKTFEDWCVQVWVSPERRKRVSGWMSYVRPNKLDFDNLVEKTHPNATLPELAVGPERHLRLRDGFKLTDNRMSVREYLREIDYCIYCHLREKDSCSKGFVEKTGGYKFNPLGIELTGCPLDERISEMHILRKQGELIAALAMIMLDNPMCPGTGHRICNDCMKGCIYQKQDPVNIPQTETGILTDILNLPYGFEIYSLLTRFNPLNRWRPYALPYNGVNVLVVGLGPAGYTLAHYLANEGFGVVGVDGLKLEPVDDTLTGANRAIPKPIQKYSDLKKELDERTLMGFGGVSEYGITVRWDKNFLTVIYLTLLRRRNLRVYGGVRFGGTITLEDAWKMGFQHVAVATGAGKPTVIDMKNNLIRGIRKASDFLMALQLTGAFKKNALANLQVQLPAIIIGGGLTAIDTATELLAYYPVQVEKTLERFEALSRAQGEATLRDACSEEEKGILSTFLEHGKAVREERRRAAREKRSPNFISLCREWGGVSLVYRKRMVDSPAYRLNHEEVVKALEEGIQFIENLSPTEAHRDPYGAVQALTFKRADGSTVMLPAKSVCVAAGTSPNIIYEKEFPGTFELDEKRYFFKKFIAEETHGKFELRPAQKAESGAFFLSYCKDGKYVSYYGDNHPDFAGNVVKAMASAKLGAPKIFRLFEKQIKDAENSTTERLTAFETLTQTLDESLMCKVVRVDRLTPTIVEVILSAKLPAQKFEPGQFYRLQNFESQAHSIDGTKLLMEGMALTGAWVDKTKGLLSLIVLEMGASSRLVATLKPGDPVVVMGPTGTPSEIGENETVLLAGGGLGNAVLLSIAAACKQKNCNVIYFAGYRRKTDLFKQAEIEKVTDQVVWAVDGGELIQARRPNDLSYCGNIVQAMLRYSKGELQKNPLFPLKTVNRLIAIGSDRMMAAVTKARHDVLKPYLNPNHIAIASINSSMQCMMKEVCAQCLQKHIDPTTKKETVVFSCFNQDQEMDQVDFDNLTERLRVNSLSEKLANRYLDYLFQSGSIERI